MRKSALLIVIILFSGYFLAAQETFLMRGVVLDHKMKPVPYTHVIAKGSQQGDVTDKQGVFVISTLASDSLLILNLAFHDTIVYIDTSDTPVRIQLKPKAYDLNEAKIFDWGSSYEDMLAEVERLGPPSELGEEIGLPQQDPDVIPFYLDEKVIKNKKMLLVAPVSYFYYNKSKREQNIRKAFRLEQDADKIELYNHLTSQESLSEISNFRGDSLQAFYIYVIENLTCDYHCPELKLIQEIHNLHELYKKQNN